MALYLLYGIVSITRRFKLTELLVDFMTSFSCSYCHKDDLFCVTMGQPYNIMKSKMAACRKFKSKNRQYIKFLGTLNYHSHALQTMNDFSLYFQPFNRNVLYELRFPVTCILFLIGFC